MTDNAPSVQHDENNGKFYVPFPDKQAVLRYNLDEEEEAINFQSIFVPPSLREDGLAKQIVHSAYSYAEENSLQPIPSTPEDFLANAGEHF